MQKIKSYSVFSEQTKVTAGMFPKKSQAEKFKKDLEKSFPDAKYKIVERMI